MNVQIAVQIQPQHAQYAQIRDAVMRAEDAGVDVIYNWDHFFPLRGEPDGLHFECWSMLAAWAEQTERVQLGALVTCNSYRNPDLLADMARTVDHISDGRLIFGIGSGWFERDYTEYGYEFGTAGSRLDALGEALPRIRRRWEQLNPQPTRELPILIGGAGEKKTLRYVAEHANIWHTFITDVEELRRKDAVLRQHCEAVGREESEILRSVGLERTGDIVGHAQKLYDAGVRAFTAHTGGPDFDFTELNRLLAWRAVL